MSGNTPSSMGNEFLANLEGIFKRFRITKENEKDKEILTLANLDSGYIRKFIVKKVDERSLFGRRNSQKSQNDENENKSRNNSKRSKNVKNKNKKSKDNERRNSTGSLNSLKSNISLKSTISLKNFVSNNFGRKVTKGLNSGKSKSTDNISEAKGRKISLSKLQFGWGSTSDLEDNNESMMTAKDNTDKDDPGVINPAFVPQDLDEVVDVDKDETSSRRSDGDGMSDTDSVSSMASTSSAPDISKFNLKMSPRPLRRSHRSHSQQHSPESYRSSYQSNRSSVCSTRKGILKKTASSTTINMEMANLSQPQTPTDNSHTPRLSDAFDDNCSNGDISRFSRSTDDVPLHHQRSFNRVKFILDSGRPDNVTGDYDDIKIEKIDRNLGLERGKMIEKDANGLSKSGRRCLLFTAGLLVVTMAVILGSLFGSRKLGNIQTKSSISPLDDKFIHNAIEGRFKITNKEFSDSLHNYESEEFKKMSKDLEALISKVIYHEATTNLVNSTVTLRIIKILKGSLVPIFRIKWEEKDDISDEEIRKRIMRHLDKFGSIGEYKVDKVSVSVANLQNNCHEAVSSCSHTCVFSDQTLRFLCRCPDTLVLTNNTICTSPQQPTRKMPFIVPPVVNNIIKDSGAQFHSVNPETVEKKKSEELALQDSVDNSPLSNSGVKNGTTATSTSVGSASPVATFKPKDVVDENKKLLIDNERDKLKKNIHADKKEPLVINDETSKKENNNSLIENDLKTIKEKGDKGKKTIIKDKLSSMLEDKKQEEMKKTNVKSNVSVAIEKMSIKEKVKMSKFNKTENKNGTNPQNDTDKKKDNSSIMNSDNNSTNNQLSTILTKETTVIPESELVGDKQQTTMDVNDTKAIEIKTDEEESKKSKPADLSDENIIAEEIKKLNGTKQTNEDFLFVPKGTSSGIGLDVPPLNSSSIDSISNIENRRKFPGGNINESDDKLSEPEESNINIIEHSTVPTQTKDFDNKNLKSNDFKTSSLQTETSIKESETSLLIETMINNTEKHIASNDSVEMAEGMVNFTSISKKEGSLQFNTSGSTQEKLVTVKNISSFDSSTLSKTPQEPNKSKNSTLLGILVPSQFKEKIDTTLSPSTDEHSANTTNISSFENSTSTTTNVVTVQAIPLSDIIMTKSNYSTSPVISTLLSGLSTKGIPSSTESSKGSNDMPGKPINIGDIADVSNILSFGNMSLHDKKPNIVESGENSLTNLTSSTDWRKENPNNEVMIPEEKRLCKLDQFQCDSGGSRFGICIPKSSRCDSVYDCFDRSDEKDCIDNKCFSNYQCWSGDCVQREFVCDGIRHCADGGDEEGCETWKCSDEEFKCQSTKGRICIPSSQRCDGQSDCFDNSDERNCSKECTSDNFLCPEGWCIPNIWKCDGTLDCAGGEDEQECDCNGLDQSPCVVGGCVPTFKLCDGLRQCPDGSDEYSCLRIDNNTKQLEIRSETKRWSPVCGDKWTNGWTELVCEQLGFGGAISTEVKRVNESVPRPRVKLSPEAPKVAQRGRAPLQYFLTPGECATEPLVHVSCKQPTCGIWPKTNPDSQNEDPAWPSLGLLIQPGLYEDHNIAFTHSCAATIITPVWVIASYSCLLSRPQGLGAEEWAFLIGESSPTVGQRNTQLRHAKQVVVHPGAKKKNGIWVGDAALLRLQSPLVLDESTRLACLPDKPMGTHSHCKIATWTEKNRDTQEGVTQIVQRLPVPNLTTKTCNISYYNGKLDSSHVCASFMQNSYSPCKGREGSPLMCKSDDGSWQIHGLLSLTSTCARFELPSLFTDINSIKQWIMNTVEKKQSNILHDVLHDAHNEDGNPMARSLHGANDNKNVIKSMEPANKEVIIEESL